MKSIINDVCELQILESFLNLSKISNLRRQTSKTLKMMQKSLPPRKRSLPILKIAAKLYATSLIRDV